MTLRAGSFSITLHWKLTLLWIALNLLLGA
jgi:hypothetical protein